MLVFWSSIFSWEIIFSSIIFICLKSPDRSLVLKMYRITREDFLSKITPTVCKFIIFFKFLFVKTITWFITMHGETIEFDPLQFNAVHSPYYWYCTTQVVTLCISPKSPKQISDMNVIKAVYKFRKWLQLCLMFYTI